MIKLVILFLCCSESLSDWMDRYNNDNRPLCPTGRNKKPLGDEGRIVGGIPAGKKRFPFAVSMLFIDDSEEIELKGHFCGGSLVTDSHVLTAAHCIYPEPVLMLYKDMIRLSVGDYDIDDTKEVTSYVREIDRALYHPEYAGDFTHDNDIAIVTLNESVPLDGRIRMPVLPPLGRELNAGTRCTIWGWGRTELVRSSILLKVRVPIVARKLCRKQVPNNITRNMICAGGERGRSACFGDSGGSLLSQEGNIDCLVGIATFHDNEMCELEGVPSVYVNVARFTRWIYQNTRSGSCKPQIIQ